MFLSTSPTGGPAVAAVVGTGAHAVNLSSAELEHWRGALACAAVQPVGSDLDGADADAAIALIEQLRGLASAVAALQVRAAVVVDRGRRAQEAATGVPARRRGAGVAAEIGLARHVSAHRAATLLGMAKAVVTEMPATHAALAAGHLDEWRTILTVRETACLPIEDRQRVDHDLCGTPGTGVLAGCGDRELVQRARQATYRIDPGSVVRRAAQAETDRRVTLRPAPDTMTYLTALLPVTQGVAAYAASRRQAAAARAAGDERSRGQVMADTLVERVTGQEHAGDVPIRVNLVMTDTALLHRSDDPGLVPGYGTVPAGWARQVALGTGGAAAATAPPDRATCPDQDPGTARQLDHGRSDPQRRQARRWIRRLYLAPDTDDLVAMDSRSRTPPPGLADLIRLRDADTCRIPWCDAPGRHLDHAIPHADGGPTSAENIQLLCEAHNDAKEAPGWSVCAPGEPTPAHRLMLRTPSGSSHTSQPPPLPGTSPAKQSDAVRARPGAASRAPARGGPDERQPVDALASSGSAGTAHDARASPIEAA